MSATSRTLIAVLAVVVPIAAQASPAALFACSVRDHSPPEHLYQRRGGAPGHPMSEPA